MIKVITGDITKLDVDAIVNAANRTLLGGGGVDGAIHRAAGPQLLEECYTLHGCETGEAKITKGYNLPAQYVIHTVGPIWQGGGADEEVQLAACYWNSLRLAADNGCRSIAFPAISTGVYGYPKEAAAKTAVAAIEAFLRRRERENEGGDMLVILCAFSAGDAKIYEQVLAASPEEASEAEESPKTGADYIHSLEGAVSEEVLQDVAAFLNARMEEEETFGSVPDEAAAPILRVGKANVPAAAVPQMYGSVTAEMSVEPEAICDSAMPDFPDLEMPFRDKLFELIDARGLSDPEVYKRANIDRKLFSKIRNSEAYTPKKKTALALAVALELTPEETEDLLCRAGYALSPSSRFDMIIRYFLEKGEYDIFMINATLYAYDEPLLGL